MSLAAMDTELELRIVKNKFENIFIREADAEDTLSIYEIESACFAEAWSLDIVKNLFSSDYDKVYLLEESVEPFSHSTPIAYMNIRILAGEAELMRIAVLKAYRARGLSKILMSKLIEVARLQNLSRIVLEVSSKNKIALALYSGLGFITDGIRKNYYAHGEDAVLMSLFI